MSYQLISKTLPAARKEYSCIWCSEKILIGEIHLKEVGEFEGDFQSNRWHEECHNAAQMYFNESGENEFTPYENKRGSIDEKSVVSERMENGLCVVCGSKKQSSGITLCADCHNKAHNPSVVDEDKPTENGWLRKVLDDVKKSKDTMTIPTSEFLEMKKKLDDYNDWLHLFVELEDSSVPFFEQLHKKYGDKYKIAYGWRTKGKCAESEKLKVETPNTVPCPCITSGSKCNYACPCGDSVMSGVCVNCHNTGTMLKFKSILKTPSEWQKEMPEVIIWDCDGWRSPDYKDWNEPITYDEYLTRRNQCTCKFTNLNPEEY